MLDYSQLTRLITKSPERWYMLDEESITVAIPVELVNNSSLPHPETLIKGLSFKERPEGVEYPLLLAATEAFGEPLNKDTVEPVDYCQLIILDKLTESYLVISQYPTVYHGESFTQFLPF